jgi:protein ImuA
MEEALRCRAVGVVIGEMRAGKIDEIAVRRLSLAAGESGALALLLRAAPAGDSSTAATRWIVGAAPSFVIPGREPTGPREARPDDRFHERTRNDEEIRPRFAAHLVRNRRGPVGSWILEWSDSDERFILATHAQPVAAPALDRPHRQVA